MPSEATLLDPAAGEDDGALPGVAAGPARTKIVVRALDFYYRDYHALKNVNLEIPERQITAIIGPSGCGKSTLLRVFNRIYSVYAGLEATGEVLLDGENILDRGYSLNRLRTRVGMVFQKAVPFPLSVFENVAFGLRHHIRLSRGQMEDRVEKALRAWLLDRLEARSYWFDAQGRPIARSINQLADPVTRDTDLVSVLQLWDRRKDRSVTQQLSALLDTESVPFLAAYRLKDSGLRKRESWEHTWALQRREDKGEKVGEIPVPQKYTTADFRKQAWWHHRGKLDVPKERFILYPEAGRETGRHERVGEAYRQVIRGLEVAGTQRFAEAVREHHPQLRPGLHEARLVDQGAGDGEGAVAVRVRGHVEGAHVPVGHRDRLVEGMPQGCVHGLQRRSDDRVLAQGRPIHIDELRQQQQSEDRDAQPPAGADPGPAGSRLRRGMQHIHVREGQGRRFRGDALDFGDRFDHIRLGDEGRRPGGSGLSLIQQVREEIVDGRRSPTPYD